MNKTINKFLSTEDEFMPELHLKQPEVTYSACGTFTKHRERIQGFRKTGNLNHLYRSESDKACFAHMLHILIVKIWKKELFQIKF